MAEKEKAEKAKIVKAEKKEEKIKESKLKIESAKKTEKQEPFKQAGLFNDPWKIIQYPYLTEKSIGMIESQNKLIFVVRRDSTKIQIKKAIESALSVKLKSVNTLIDSKGRKKAIIQLKKEFKASDIATRFGML